jgi:hypothetical protein
MRRRQIYQLKAEQAQAAQAAQVAPVVLPDAAKEPAVAQIVLPPPVAPKKREKLRLRKDDGR